ncbi:MAG: hypothetical protein ACRD24_06415, partial [Terriglobales bacterium]
MSARFLRMGFRLLLVVGVPLLPSEASCVLNSTDQRIYAEFYGEKVDKPRYDRGGSWLNPGEQNCLEGQAGDWLLSAPNWINGKPSDWQRRESQDLGGTADRPHGYWLYAPAPRDGSIEVHQFKRYQEKSGYWLYCDYRIRGMFTYTLQIEGATGDALFVNERKSASYRLNAGNSPVINLNRFFRRGPNQFDLWKQFEKVRIV